MTSACDKHNIFQEFSQIFVRFYIFTWVTNTNKILRGLETNDINDPIKTIAYKKFLKKHARTEQIKKMKKLQ